MLSDLAISPVPINQDNLFSLDVDDDIWQDIGLDEHETEVKLGRKWTKNTSENSIQ